MTTFTTETLEVIIRGVLDTIKDPCSVGMGCPLGLVEMGLVAEVDMHDGVVRVSLRLTSPGCYFVSLFQQEIEERLIALDGVQSVEVCILHDDMSWSEDLIAPQSRTRLLAARRTRLARMKGKTPQ